MTEPEKAVARLKELHAAAYSAGININAGEMYVDYVAKGLERLVAQEFGLYDGDDVFRSMMKEQYIGWIGSCEKCRMLNVMFGSPFAKASIEEKVPCRFSCLYYWPNGMDWPWLYVAPGVRVHVEAAMWTIMWLRLKRAVDAGEDVKTGEWRAALAKDLDEVCHKACDAIGRRIEWEKNDAAEGQSPSPAVGSFRKSDRKMLSKVYRRVVLEETPDDAQRAGDIRQRQVLHGVGLYRPSTKGKPGISFREAARRTINDGKFKGKGGRPLPGTYTLNEINTLAQAIRRAYNAGER